ncbi:MAG: class I SAM-dependent rRNA methyltransferase [Clostridia bacterium]|nr:class I SAM-dependent rRNA methyltransferase [Clostridia bacterium]
MENTQMAIMQVSEKAERSIKGGHPWVFAEEIRAVDGEYENGGLVQVRSLKGRFLGTGFVCEQSKIRVRIISTNANDRFDEAFFARRIKYAIDYRRTVMGSDADFACCRLIFGEADCFPGLTVDRFGPVLVTQCLSRGIERIKPMLYRLIVDDLRARGEQIDALYERNDVKIRELEGLEQYTAFWPGEGLRTDLDGSVEIVENGIRYAVDYFDGQKTGFFLDQKYNRAAVAKLARGRRVLDCFTHTGAFALNAAAGGAEHVTAVDVSEHAIASARANAALNGLEGRMDFLCADVFELLTQMGEAKKCDYDMIILDPPAFTKSRDTLKSAIRGYREINRRAMQLLPRGGYLATCSCSHFMRDDYFRDMLRQAAADAQVTLRQIEARQQSPDHPIVPTIPETDYLKFYTFQVV